MNFFKIVFSIFLIWIGNLANATTVEVVWPFSIASSTTNYIREVIDYSNKSQNKYNFVLVQKTGAGGSVAATYVKNNKSISLLATSNAFFVRPNLYPNQSYDPTDFKPLIAMGSMPMALIGKAGTNWETIIRKEKITIGIPGYGTFSHVIADHFSKAHTQTVIVPYQGTTEALRDVAAGVLDLSLDVPSMALNSPSLYKIHYITGSQDHNQKFKLASSIDPVFSKLSLEFMILANRHLDRTVSTELSAILKQAHSNNSRVTEMYSLDFVTPIGTDPNLWFENNLQTWKALTKNIKVIQ